MSIIPKISVGMPKSRDKHNLSFDCSTTTNIGAIQPTMCREMVPNETFKVKVNSMVRLAPMTVPTFGRMSLRHYHAFIPYKDIWEPFDAMLSGQSYTPATNLSFIPTQVPTITMIDFIPFILQYSDISVCYGTNVSEHYGTTENLDVTDKEAVQAALDNIAPEFKKILKAFTFGHTSANIDAHTINVYDDNNERTTALVDGSYRFKFAPYHTRKHGRVILGNMLSFDYDSSHEDKNLTYATAENPDGNVYYDPTAVPLSYEGADLITQVKFNVDGAVRTYYVLFKFLPELKRLRSLMIGLGYQFSPYSDVDQSFFKLVAYYKMWFELFRPKREINWQNTNCYHLLMVMNGYDGLRVGSSSDMRGMTAGQPQKPRGYFLRFMHDVIEECFYYLPMDYFSMAVNQPQQSNSDIPTVIGSQLGLPSTSDQTTQGTYTINGRPASQTGSEQFPIVGYNPVSGSQPNPLMVKLGLRLLTFANKNTVVGRSIRDYLKVHFGISPQLEHDSSEVIRIGSQRLDVQIGDVMATSSSAVPSGDPNNPTITPLGDYGGRGYGAKEGQKFDFTAKEFGCWLTVSVVVPESGYFQGYLGENRHINRLQFFTPEFDALGYQVLERGEVMDSYNCDSIAYSSVGTWNPVTDFKRSKAWGFVPRYSEYKVARNIINGDFSLPGRMNEMAAYTFDRRISEGFVANAGFNSDGLPVKTIVKPSFVPSMVYDEFRKIDSEDHLGQYNRIFFSQSNDEDHFLIHNSFEVTAIAPFKSLSTSFDTIQQGERDIDITKA